MLLFSELQNKCFGRIFFMKMRVMYATNKKKLISYADAIGQAFGCLINDIPPAYPADKERLVILALSLKGGPSDRIRRFCSELSSDRTKNVALIIDGEKGSDGEKQVIEILKNAGTNVIDETYYVKCGIFGGNITLSERQAIVDWTRKVQNIASEA